MITNKIMWLLGRKEEVSYMIHVPCEKDPSKLKLITLEPGDIPYFSGGELKMVTRIES